MEPTTPQTDRNATREESPSRALVLASWLSTVALALSAVAAVIWVVVITDGAWAWTWVLPLISVAVAPALLSIAVAALLRHIGTLTTRAAVWVGVVGSIAWTLGALTVASWSTGFDEADAGLPRSTFGGLFLPLALASWAAATAATTPVMAALLVPARRRWIAWMGAAILCAIAVVPAGFAVIAPAPGVVVALVVSIAVLTIVQRLRRAPRSSDTVDGARAPLSRRPVPEPLRREQWRLVATFAGVSGIAGLACGAFALSGTFWPGVSLDGTQAMNAGLSAGAVAAVPLVLALGIIVANRFGAWMWVAAGSGLLALGFVAAAQGVGAGNSMQWPLSIGAAVGIGLVTAVVLTRALPHRGLPRVLLGIGVGVGTAGTLGLMAAMLLPLAAPIVAVWLLVWASRAGRSVGAGRIA